jgi:hypothetical protein
LQLRDFNDRRPSQRPYYNPLAIPLPYPPLISITSVKYLDATGTDVPMTLGTDYRILGQADLMARPAIAPLYSKTWPVALRDDASVRIRYTCGYDATGIRTAPAQLSSAICLGVRALLPVLSRDGMIAEDRVEGIGWKKYQNNPQFADVIKSAVANLLVNLSVA